MPPSIFRTQNNRRRRFFVWKWPLVKLFYQKLHPISYRKLRYFFRCPREILRSCIILRWGRLSVFNLHFHSKIFMQYWRNSAIFVHSCVYWRNYMRQNGPYFLALLDYFFRISHVMLMSKSFITISAVSQIFVMKKIYRKKLLRLLVVYWFVIRIFDLRIEIVIKKTTYFLITISMRRSKIRITNQSIKKTTYFLITISMRRSKIRITNQYTTSSRKNFFLYHV